MQKDKLVKKLPITTNSDMKKQHMNLTEKQQNQKNQAEEKCAKMKTQFYIQKEKINVGRKNAF